MTQIDDRQLDEQRKHLPALFAQLYEDALAVTIVHGDNASPAIQQLRSTLTHTQRTLGLPDLHGILAPYQFRGLLPGPGRE